jgi:hypothetical protein
VAYVTTNKGFNVMKIKHVQLGLILLFVVAGAFKAMGAADAATEAFIRDVIKDARTDNDRSALLMEAVALAEGNVKLKVALLERSVQYGIKALRTTDDCEKYLGAVTNLVNADPDRRGHWLSQSAVIYQRWAALSKSASEKRRLTQLAVDAFSQAGSASAAAGEWKKAAASYNQGKLLATAKRLPSLSKITNYARTATHVSRTQGKIAGYIVTLKEKPEDLDARSNLIKMLVTVMDDPAEAMKYVNEDVDQKYRVYLPMAAKDLSTLPVASCKTLGAWYHQELSKTVIGVVKSRMLARARACYERVLALHTTVDVTSAALKLSLTRIKSEQAKVGNVDPLLCAACASSGMMPCESCLTNGKSTGLRRCVACDGVGRDKCTTCRGMWSLRCTKCAGKGKVSAGTSRVGAMVYKNYRTCSGCKGRGLTYRKYRKSTRWTAANPKYYYTTYAGKCPTCSKTRPEKLRGTSPCIKCSGKGGAGICGGCQGKKIVTCTHCSSK